MTLMRTLISAISGMAFTIPALAQHDYVIWRDGLGIAPNESLEFVYERADRPLQAQISNTSGQVIATIDLAADPAVASAGTPSLSKGFGFVTFASESGALVVDGTRYGALDMNPRTGRYLIGFTLLGSKATPAGIPTVGSLTVVGPGGETRYAVKVTSYSANKSF